MVGDAYLSDDEGLHSGRLGLDDLAAELHLDAAAGVRRVQYMCSI